MGSFRERFSRFMAGRYGTDQLNIGLLVLYFVFFLIHLLTRHIIFSSLMWAVLAWSLFRTLSKNIYGRQKENRAFLKLWNPVKSECILTFRRLKEVRTHTFRKCPQCKTVLRLPRKSGKHKVKCPRCKEPFQVRVLF